MKKRILTDKEAKTLFAKLQNLSEDQNSRHAEEDDAHFFMETFGLIEDDEIGCEYVAGRLYPEQPEIMIHNVNHFRLAKPSRRMEQEFGLGAPPSEIFYKDSKEELVPLIPKEEAKQEESLVTCLDWLCSIEGDYEVKSIVLKPKYSDLQVLYSWGIINKDGSVRKKALRKESHEIPVGKK